MISFNTLGRLGRLGNQMFQYASLKGIAKNNKLNFCIPYSYNLNDWTDHQLSKYFVLDENIIYKSPENQITYTESSFSFDSNLYNNCTDGLDISGYLQTEKYFIEIKEEILKDFSFKKNYPLPFNGNYNSLHVRRGDYVNQQDYHPLCSLNYYNEAIEIIGNIFPLVVVSDDIQWCKENIKADFYYENTTNIHDLYIMTYSKNNIIANSSFSWWGAWLNKTHEKIVICPKKWFGPAYVFNSTKDLIPQDWIQI